MTTTCLLVSVGLGALPDLLDDLPASLQLLHIPTASNLDDSQDSGREQLAEMGFHIDDLDLATASHERVNQAVAAADVIYVGGGNTYYLLDQINRSGFREALAARTDVVYVGGSAGTVVACPDIGYIGAELDEPGVAPDLESTRGLGLVDFYVMPHIDYPPFEVKIAELLKSFPADFDVVAIRDDQAVAVKDGERTVVDSPS